MKIVRIAHDRPENRRAKTYLFRTDRDLKKGQTVEQVFGDTPIDNDDTARKMIAKDLYKVK